MPAVLVLSWACDGTSGVQITTGAGVWATRAPVPQARTEVSAATDGSLIYLLGGFAQAGVAPRTMFVYDPTADRWTGTDSIPEGVNHAGLVHLNGKLYIIGGFREATFEPTAAVRIFDIATRRWTDGAPLPTARGALAVTVLNGRIHAIGGNAANAGSLDPREHVIGSDNSSVGTHEVYDPVANSWTRLSPMPTARNHLAAVTLNGRIHAVAGRVGGNATMTTHEVFDPGANTWSAAPPVPTGRSGVAAVAFEQRLYLFGGETFGAVTKTFDEAERFDPATNQWESMPRMPTARHGLAAAAVSGSIHVLSGGPSPGFAFSGANEVLTPTR
jgi:N-acetylneuraminic acid mutarotase